MKKLCTTIFIVILFLLGGCGNLLKTMVAHIRINNSESGFIAKGNAFTNFCLSKNMMNRQTAYEFSTVAAELLDLVVYDNNYYKITYDNTISEWDGLFQKNPSEAAPTCKELENKLPEITAKLQKNYISYARELGVARSEENRRIAESMSNFRVPNTPMPQMNFPNVNFSPEKSQTQNFLVNTKNGITQCRVTNGNFVFCL